MEGKFICNSNLFPFIFKMFKGPGGAQRSVKWDIVLSFLLKYARQTAAIETQSK